MKRASGCRVSRPRSFDVWNCFDGDLRRELIKDIRRGMGNSQKTIPSKYFYDASGSRLFLKVRLDVPGPPWTRTMGGLEVSGPTCR